MSEDKVICNICKNKMNVDVFAFHAAARHEDEVFALLSDDTIIKELSKWVE